MIMRKETFAIHTESEIAKDQIMRDLIECIDFASSGRLLQLAGSKKRFELFLTGVISQSIT